jgi:hypothetical protein
MILRILNNESAEEQATTARKQELTDVFAALQFFVLNKECCHATLESSFSCPESLAEQSFVDVESCCSEARASCSNSCSICSRKCAHFFPAINKMALVLFLESALSDVSKLRPKKMKDLCACLNKKSRWKKIGTLSA